MDKRQRKHSSSSNGESIGIIHRKVDLIRIPAPIQNHITPMNNITISIIEYLQKEYNAKAIILHGSRARGNPHKQSDWDLLVFTDKIIKGNGGAKLENEELDIKVIQLPIANIEKFISDYPQSCQFTKILLDTDDKVANRIQDSAKEIYKKGINITPQQKENIKKHFDRMLNRLIDFEDDPKIFFYHLSSFYIKTIRYWFEYQNRWSQPISEALKIIENENTIFLNELTIITDNNKTNKEKISAAEKIIKSKVFEAPIIPQNPS